MRKLIVSAAIVLISSAAIAGGSRGLSRPDLGAAQAEPPRVQRQAEVKVLAAPAEQPATTEAPQSVEDKLKAAGELRPDGIPLRAPEPQTQAPAPAPVQAAPTPVQAARAPVQATAPVKAKPVVQAQRPRKVKKRVARRGESNERQARRIAARFGIYW